MHGTRPAATSNAEGNQWALPLSGVADLQEAAAPETGSTAGRDSDGETYERERDYGRLVGLLGRVRVVMNDNRWHTLAYIQSIAGGTEASCSARLRDLRKARFGGYRVERRHVSDGLWEYRVLRTQTGE